MQCVWWFIVESRSFNLFAATINSFRRWKSGQTRIERFLLIEFQFFLFVLKEKKFENKKNKVFRTTRKKNEIRFSDFSDRRAMNDDLAFFEPSSINFLKCSFCRRFFSDPIVTECGVRRKTFSSSFGKSRIFSLFSAHFLSILFNRRAEFVSTSKQNWKLSSSFQLFVLSIKKSWKSSPKIIWFNNKSNICWSIVNLLRIKKISSIRRRVPLKFIWKIDGKTRRKSTSFVRSKIFTKLQRARRTMSLSVRFVSASLHFRQNSLQSIGALRVQSSTRKSFFRSGFVSTSSHVFKSIGKSFCLGGKRSHCRTRITE